MYPTAAHASGDKKSGCTIVIEREDADLKRSNKNTATLSEPK